LCKTSNIDFFKNIFRSDVGALDDIREELEVSILAPVNYPELTEALGLEAPTGILLCGPPGCGKTLLAKAVANQAGINFISVKGPELLNMVKNIFSCLQFISALISIKNELNYVIEVKILQFALIKSFIGSFP
jgi:Holliday junction resolvasome RuvABC ATP-dependent DNA helicase subunit